MDKVQQSQQRRMLRLLILVGLLMFGFGYLLVPIYKVVCQATGVNGKTGGQVDYTGQEVVDKERWVTVEFLSTLNAELPWKFYPLAKRIKVHPGEINRVDFFVENNSGKQMTVQAVPSVTPGIAAKSLKKTECFCFTRQTVRNGEAQKWPLLFHIDRDLPKDISTVTLAYTLFDISNISTTLRRGEGKITQ